jgi:hypothetical protein
MKKPNITEGEWKSFSSIEPHGLPTEICRIGVSYYVMTDGDPSETEEQDAKAISAVPEMIDALCSVYLDYELESVSYSTHNSLVKVLAALKKAGVEL